MSTLSYLILKKKAPKYASGISATAVENGDPPPHCLPRAASDFAETKSNGLGGGQPRCAGPQM